MVQDSFGFGQEIPVRNPRSGVTDHVIHRADPAPVAAALRAMQPAWEALGPEGRAVKLEAFADAIRARHGEIAEALTADTGRRAISLLEVDSMLGVIARWAASAPAMIAAVEDARIDTAIPEVSTATRLVPYALVGAISPWNFPLTLSLIDAIPALAAGSAVLVKPSEVTPRFIGPLMQAVAAVPGLPLALIEGDGATGAALVEQVDFLVFTGSVATGRKVGEAAARAFIPASLELGGKDPMLVLQSADPAAAAALALRASVVNTGQACQSIERVLVAKEIAAPFLDALVQGANAVRLNWPDIKVGDIGPFIFARQAAIVQAQIDEAVAKGARLLAGGKVEELGGGLYLRPTVLVDVTPDMAVVAEETFGPVIPVSLFSTVDQAVAMANAGRYGLSAAVVAGSVEEAEGVAARLHAGAVSINDGSLTSMVWEAEKTSFKASGLGPSRMGASGLLRFFRRQVLIRQSGRALPLAAYAEKSRR